MWELYFSALMCGGLVQGCCFLLRIKAFLLRAINVYDNEDT